MSAGDITQPARVRVKANERADVVDVDGLSRSVRDMLEAMERASFFTPRKTVGAPTGLIFTGFSLTLNPTGGADGKVRINTELGVALDANDGLIIKPAGVTIDVTIPAGTHQIYVYAREVLGPQATRRFLPVTAPYTEYAAQMETTYVNDYGTYVRAGNLAGVVAEDVVNGKTTPLVLIGIATNTAGAISMTGHSATTAPNGTDIINRLSSVVSSMTAPDTNAENPGGVQSLHDLLTFALYKLAITKWNRSTMYTPAAGTNFGAYTDPPIGVDRAGREITDVVTIGNGTTSFGSVNTADYANSNLCLDAALALLNARVGTPKVGRVFVKPGVLLNSWAANVTIPANLLVVIEGASDSLNTVPQIDINGAFGFVSGASAGVRFENIFCRTIGTAALHAFGAAGTWFKNKNCRFARNGTGGVAIFTHDTTFTQVDDVEFTNCTFEDAGQVANDATKYAFIDGGATSSEVRRFTLLNCRFITAGNFAHNGIRLTNNGGDLTIDMCKFVGNNSAAGDPATSLYWLTLRDNDGLTSFTASRRVTNCTFTGAASHASNALYSGIFLNDTSYVTIDNCFFGRLEVGIGFTGSVPPHKDIRISNCRFIGAAEGTATANKLTAISCGNPQRVDGMSIINCLFDTWNVSFSATTLTNPDLEVIGCTFKDAQFKLNNGSCQEVRVKGCKFLRTSSSITPYIPLHLEANIAGGGVLWQTAVEGCTFRGFAQPDVDTTALCIYLAGNMKCVMVTGNQFFDLDNEAMNYSSAALHGIIEVDTNDIEGLTISNNIAQDIMNTASLGTAAALFDVQLVIFDNVVSEPGSVSNFQVVGNNIGDIDSHCGLYFDDDAERRVWLDARFSDNIVHTIVNTANYTERCGIFIQLDAFADDHGALLICDNVWDLHNPNASTFGGNIIVVLDGAVAGNTWSIIEITGNLFNMNQQGFTANSGIFINCDIGGFMFRDNVSRKTNTVAGAAAVMWINMNGVAIGDSDPNQPGAGVLWPDNIGIHNV